MKLGIYYFKLCFQNLLAYTRFNLYLEKGFQIFCSKSQNSECIQKMEKLKFE